MGRPLVLHYPRCSTCAKALKWLDAHGVAYEARDIVQDRPSADELERWLELSAKPVKAFFNTSGKVYRERKIKDQLQAGMTDKEACRLLAEDGMLVKRPLVVLDARVLVGFHEDEWEEALLKDWD